MLSSIKFSVAECFNGDELFDFRTHVAIATRHGWKQQGGAQKYKLSFRVFVLRYKIKYMQMPVLIREACPGTGFDLSPYKGREQLLAVVGGCKGVVGNSASDLRVLTPLTHQDQPEAFLVQHLTGAEQELEMLPQTSEGSVSNRGTNAKSLGLDNIDSRILPAIESALAAMDPSDTTSRFSKAAILENGTVSMYMRTVRERKCPHGNHHTSNNFYVPSARRSLSRTLGVGLMQLRAAPASILLLL